MADSKITSLQNLTSADPANDMLPIVDVSDNLITATGTTKRISINNILACSPVSTLASVNVTGSTIPANGLYLPTTNTLEFAANSLAQYRIAPLGVFSWYDGAGGTRMTLNSTGLGVGDSPFAGTRLTLRESATNPNALAMTNRNATQTWRLSVDVNAVDDKILGFYDSTSTTFRMQLTDTGNLGLGVTPSAWGGFGNLQLATSGSTVVSGYDQSLGVNYFSHSSGAYKYTVNGKSVKQAMFDGKFVWSVSGTVDGVAGAVIAYNPAMTLDASGNLLVGVTSTSTPGVGNTTAGGSLNANGAAFFSHASSQALYLNTNVDGQIVSIRRSNVAVGSISVTTTGTTFNSLSDYRLKESVAPLSGGLARISALKPSIYKWKSDGSSGEGFLAHELAEVVPSAVTGDKDAVDADGKPTYQGIDLSKLVPILVAAIQELTARVQTLEAK